MNRLHNLKGEIKTQLLIVTDKNGNKQGLATREECHTGEGRTHLAFLAFIINENKEIILAQRASNKSLWNNFWDASAVSHVLPGETVEAASTRRGKEEMGVEVYFRDLGAFHYFEKYKDGCENEYCHVLMGTALVRVVYNPVEIKNIKNISYPVLKEEINKNPGIYTPWLTLAIRKKYLDEYFK